MSEYIKEAGFYSYDAADDTDDPVRRWIGREVKRFLHEADIHLPFLRALSSAKTDVAAETREMHNANGEEAMDLSGDEFDAGDDEVADEAELDPLLLTNASRWDHFLDWVATKHRGPMGARH